MPASHNLVLRASEGLREAENCAGLEAPLVKLRQTAGLKPTKRNSLPKAREPVSARISRFKYKGSLPLSTLKS